MDMWTISEDGHIVGHDGFVVPASFNEFMDRFPDYGKQMAYKFLPWAASDDERMDMAQDIWTTLLKHRVVEKFEPRKFHGANKYRFFSYVNLCCRRASITRWRQGTTEPDNIGLSMTDDETSEGVTSSEEFIHQNRAEPTTTIDPDVQIYYNQFRAYVEEQDPWLGMVMDALVENPSRPEAEEALGLKYHALSYQMQRLRRLGAKFACMEASSKL